MASLPLPLWPGSRTEFGGMFRCVTTEFFSPVGTAPVSLLGGFTHAPRSGRGWEWDGRGCGSGDERCEPLCFVHWYIENSPLVGHGVRGAYRYAFEPAGMHVSTLDATSSRVTEPHNSLNRSAISTIFLFSIFPFFYAPSFFFLSLILSFFLPFFFFFFLSAIKCVHLTRLIMNRRNCNFFNLENTLALKRGRGGQRTAASTCTHRATLCITVATVHSAGVLRQLFRMRGTAFLYVTWKWKTFPCKSQSWRTSNGGTHSTNLPSRPSSRRMFRQFAVCSNMYADGADERAVGKERKPWLTSVQEDFSKWDEQVSLCNADLCWNVKAARLCCFSRFLPTSRSPFFGVYLPPARLDFTQWVHFARSS